LRHFRTDEVATKGMLVGWAVDPLLAAEAETVAEDLVVEAFAILGCLLSAGAIV
jgi:hypothetical protein